MRLWCERELTAVGIDAPPVQTSLSYNRLRGTVRGMHLQLPPSRESKIVRCVCGSILDVAIDLRPESPTFMRTFAVELTRANRRALFIPPRFAHGFQTLEDETDVLYQMSDYHQPELAWGFRWDDPHFAIDWPQRSAILISARHAAYPDVTPAEIRSRMAAA